MVFRRTQVNRLLAKLGDDGFSLVLFGTKVADSKEFCKKFNKKLIPQDFNDWHIKAGDEITTFFEKSNEHLLLIKGFGVISYDRDLIEMVKKVAILENSCRLLTIGAVL